MYLVISRWYCSRKTHQEVIMKSSPKLRAATFALLFLALLAVDSHAETWYVKLMPPYGPGEVPTIKAGVDSAVTGDVVLLADGTYRGSNNKNIIIQNKSITVRSESCNPNQCIIDLEGNGTAFAIIFNGSSGTALEGVKVINGGGGGDFAGTAVLCYSPSITITNCIIEQCNAWGIDCTGCSPTITDCIFSENTAQYGAAILCGSSIAAPVITNCIFSGNEAGTGGAVYFLDGATPTFTNCTFSGNTSTYGEEYGGAIYCEDSSPTLNNTIIAFSNGTAVSCSGSSSVTISCCCVYGNSGGDWVDCIAGQEGVNGNFWADPQFCGVTGSGNYYLQSDSPCAPGNHPDEMSCGLIGAFPVLCGSVSTREATWGEIKTMYK
jgi:predicted outer membrane repeat protein